METTISQIIFYALAAVMIAVSVLAVTAKKMLRAATYLLFVLIGTAGLYLLLNYHFLAAVQLSVYAGGILVLFIFAIMLIRPYGNVAETHDWRKVLMGITAALAGVGVAAFVVLKTKFLYGDNSTLMGDGEVTMNTIGTALMGTGKYQYLLAFEVLSILLLVCIIGGIMIARKRK
ncbi:NADH dehydrogenase subunit J [Bacteroidia bacterium]|nr:NADH dehydrogenase subunit J [Bacteroidia bacterium]